MPYLCPLGRAYFLELERDMYKIFFKSVFDITFATVVLFCSLPLMLVISMCVIADGSSPFYLQNRVGRHGRHFKIIKFRTMDVNAEQKLASYLQNVLLHRPSIKKLPYNV